MKIRWDRFNIYLLAALAVVLACGCQSPEKKKKKQISTIRVHVESRIVSTNRAVQVVVSRDHPMTFLAERAPFLNESSVKHAAVVDVVGGFALQIEFDMRGMLLLEQYTAGNRKKHLLVFGQFVDPANPKQNLERWLAAPYISERITDGVLVFTPDATREEAEQIALGLNNVAKKEQPAEGKW